MVRSDYWFVFLILGLYSVTGIINWGIRRWGRKVWGRCLLVFFIVWAGGLWLGRVLNWKELNWPVTSVYLGYYGLGYYLREVKVTDQWWWRRRWILGLGAIGIMVVVTVGKWFQTKTITFDWFESYSPLMTIWSVVSFLMVREGQIKVGKQSLERMRWLAQASFGAFLVHYWVIQAVWPINRQLFVGVIPAVVAIPLEATGVTILSYGLIWGVSRIPRVGKTITGIRGNKE